MLSKEVRDGTECGLTPGERREKDQERPSIPPSPHGPLHLPPGRKAPPGLPLCPKESFPSLSEQGSHLEQEGHLE